MLPAILGLMGSSLASAGVLGSTMMSMPFLASAMGSGIGSLLQGGDQKDALQAAALGGLGGYLGGSMGGSSAFGANPTNPIGTAVGGLDDVATAASPFGPGMSSALHQGSNTAGMMANLTRPEAIGAGLGGLAASSMQMPEYKKPEEEEKEYPRGMPIKNTSVFPEMGYDAGKEGEFNYRIAKNYAEGGELESNSPMDMGIGGMQEGGMNDKELISSAINVIQGDIIDKSQQQVILAQFVSQFGQEALKDLIEKVQSGEIPNIPVEGDGMVKGAGDGMDDMIPSSMEGEQDVLLSDGEFVVPADVVSGIGNGSSDAGANKLEGMMDRVRELRTGGKTQPPAIPDEMMLPA
jgi:hypothetical protein